MNKQYLALNIQQWLIFHKTKPNDVYSMYMHKQYLALNNQQWLICHKTQLDQPNKNYYSYCTAECYG